MSVDSNEQLTPELAKLIERYLEFYRSLDNGDRSPMTAAQQHFVAVCRGQMKAETAHEVAYVKYRMLKAKQCPAVENGLSGVEGFGEGVPKPGWFSDEGWKRMRGQYLSNSD